MARAFRKGLMMESCEALSRIVQARRLIVVLVAVVALVVFYWTRPMGASLPVESPGFEPAVGVREVGPVKLAKSVAKVSPPIAKPFEGIQGCRYKEDRWNDGDSFHVTLPDGTEHILRLYFVDTPEADSTYVERSNEQAAYFGIAREHAAVVGEKAKLFTREALARPFFVQTRWRRALGRSNLPRYYAMIRTSTGRDLGELLVENGLARIYGTRTVLPDGSASEAYLDRTRALESKAKANLAGGWGMRSMVPAVVESGQSRER